MSSIREVAKIAGVSPATVSRVINGNVNVNEEKKKRVLDAISETGFIPNEVARALYKKSSKIIGLIVPNIENPFINELAKAIEGEAYIHGYRVMLCNSEEDIKKERESITMVQRMNADGIILITNSNVSKDEIDKSKIPVVVLDREIGGRCGVAWIQADNYAGGRMAAEHLIECGCRDIVCLRGPQKHSSARHRYKGYLDVCRENGLEPKYIECDYNFEDGIKKSKILLETYPKCDGIVAGNDMVAISLYKMLHQRGYRVPDDIQIVGFDNVNLSWLMTPELTTVAQPIKEMGIASIRIIIDQLEGRDVQWENIFPVKLLKRETTKYR